MKKEENNVYISSGKAKINKERGDRVKKVLSDEELEIRFAEDTWLNYFNRYLFEHGTITEKEYKKMTEIIATRKTKLIAQKNAI